MNGLLLAVDATWKYVKFIIETKKRKETEQSYYIKQYVNYDLVTISNYVTTESRASITMQTKHRLR